METRLKAAGVRCLEVDRARRDRRALQLIQLAERYEVPVRRVSAASLAARHGDLQHQGVSACIDAGRVLATNWQDCIEGKPQPLILVLDEVEDPRNLGACLRVADGAGADCVVVPKRHSAGLNDVARKTAAGAADSVPFLVVPNLSRSLKAMQQAGLYIVGLADADGHSLFDEQLDRPLVVVLGNEGKGLRQLTRQHCDALASLPMAGQVSSLNVSVATGIALYEVVRQRR